MTIERLVAAFKNCKLDCADWDDDVLRELAAVAMAAMTLQGDEQGKDEEC